MLFSQRLNRISVKSLIVLAVIALLSVLSGYFQPPQADEGMAAHVFQCSVVAFVGMLLVFVATTDWKRPLRSARALVIPMAVLICSFTALFYLEHYFYVAGVR